MRELTGKKLVVATHNDGKLREIDRLLAPFGYQTASLKELNLPVPEETGTRFEENAYIKAAAAAKATGLPALSDDSGLEVDILGGAPGVYTADWAEQPDGSRDFAKAMEKVEDAVREKLRRQQEETSAAEQEAAFSAAELREKRRARFVSVLCLAWPDGHAEYFRGEVEGALVWPPRGEKGFGFDPVFQPEGCEKTFGEMTAEEKHGGQAAERGEKAALSHRARAFALFTKALSANKNKA